METPTQTKPTWTAERIAALSEPEIRQLRDNAARLGKQAVAELCEQALAVQPKSAPARAPAASASRSMKVGRRLRLVSRGKAFSMRGVVLNNPLSSRSGVSRSGDVVFALWADDVTHDDGGARCLLWAPNKEGQRAWSDSAAGQERLEHCRRAIEKGAATGLFVYGERIEGVLPDDRAARVDGADAEVAIGLQVEKRGTEYWACWGRRASAQSPIGV